MIRRCSALIDQPSSMNAAASSVEQLGVGRRVAAEAEVAGRGRPAPGRSAAVQTRLTITRAVSGLFGSAIARASSSRPLPFWNGVRSGPDRTLRNRRGTGLPGRPGCPGRRPAGSTGLGASFITIARAGACRRCFASSSLDRLFSSVYFCRCGRSSTNRQLLGRDRQAARRGREDRSGAIPSRDRPAAAAACVGLGSHLAGALRSQQVAYRRRPRPSSRAASREGLRDQRVDRLAGRRRAASGVATLGGLGGEVRPRERGEGVPGAEDRDRARPRRLLEVAPSSGAITPRSRWGSSLSAAARSSSFGSRR